MVVYCRMIPFRSFLRLIPSNMTDTHAHSKERSRNKIELNIDFLYETTYLNEIEFGNELLKWSEILVKKDIVNNCLIAPKSDLMGKVN